MRKFKYTFIEEGLVKSGTIETDNKEEAYSQLLDKGITPIKISYSFSLFKRKKKKIPLLKLYPIFKQIETYLNSGRDLLFSIEAIMNSTENKDLKILLEHIHTGLSEGDTLYYAMKTSHIELPNEYLEMIFSAEKSSRLTQVLNDINESIKNKDELDKKIKKALNYPIFMLIASFSILGVIVTSVIPKLAVAFEDNDKSLPPATEFLIQASEFLSANFEFLFLIIVAMAYAIAIFYQKNNNFKVTLDYLILRAPILKELSIYYNISKWSNTLSQLVSSGLEFNESLKVSNEVLTNHKIKQDLSQIPLKISQGETFTEELDKINYLPAMFMNLIKSSQGNGNIESNLNDIKDYYQKEFEFHLDKYSSYIGPILTVFISGIILFIVFSIMTPIFEMNNIVSM